MTYVHACICGGMHLVVLNAFLLIMEPSLLAVFTWALSHKDFMTSSISIEGLFLHCRMPNIRSEPHSGIGVLAETLLWSSLESKLSIFTLITHENRIKIISLLRFLKTSTHTNRIHSAVAFDPNQHDTAYRIYC